MTTRRARTDLRRRAVALLDQQLWCWGRDVARPEGNVLLDLGMCRYRSAEQGPDRTAYTGRVAGDGTVWLWGFGLMYCDPKRGGVFLRRNGFEPLLVDTPPERPVHSSEQLGPLIRPTTAQQRATAGALVRAVAAWIAGYEHWIAETFGTAYREAILAARDKPPVVPAQEMAAAWEHLAKKATRLTLSPPTLIGARSKLLAVLSANSEAIANQPRPWEWAIKSRQQRYRTA